MPRLQALLWDVDGTLADTEQNGHRLAFNAAFAEAQLAWHWNNSTYSDLLAVTGGIERMRAWAKQQHLKSNQIKSNNQSDPLAESELEELLIRLQASKQSTTAASSRSSYSHCGLGLKGCCWRRGPQGYAKCLLQAAAAIRWKPYCSIIRN